MLLSVVIPTRNKVERLVLALHSYINQTLGKDQFEVIVVADACTDSTVETANKLRDCLTLRIIEAGRSGQSAARNIGARRTKGRLLGFMDDDVLLCPEYLERCAREIGDHDDLVVRAPVYTLYGVRVFRDPENGTPYTQWKDRIGRDSVFHRTRITRDMILHHWPSIGQQCYRLNRFERLVRDCLEEEPTLLHARWLGMSGSGVVLNRDRFFRTGGYDEAFGLWWGAESVELGYRLEQSGACFRNLEDVYSAHMEHLRKGTDTYHRSFQYFFDKHADPTIREVERRIQNGGYPERHIGAETHNLD